MPERATIPFREFQEQGICVATLNGPGRDRRDQGASGVSARTPERATASLDLWIDYFKCVALQLFWWGGVRDDPRSCRAVTQCPGEPRALKEFADTISRGLSAA